MSDDPAAAVASIERVLAWEHSLLAVRSLADLIACARAYPGEGGGPDSVSLLIVDATGELRQRVLGGGDALPAGVAFVESLYGIAPPFASNPEPWAGSYRAADHGLLFPASAAPLHVAVYPLVARGAAIGALSLGSRGHAGAVASDRAALRRHVAVVVSSVLDRLIDRARALASAVSDAVPGWHSRAYLQARLREEIARCQRHGGELTCMLIDIDGLRAVNERHGQEAGDVVLSEVAERLQSEVRASDSAAHLGADDFVVILMDTPLARSAAFAERVLRAVGAAPVRLSPDTERPVTVSIGAASVRPGARAGDCKTLADDLLARAGAALQQAKLAGGNRHSLAS